jgi:phage gp36-like protein
MTYANINHMLERFGERDLVQLTTRPSSGPAPTGIDTDRLDSVLKDAADLIDGYLGKRYPLPLSPVPSMVVRWSCDLARWFLQPGAPPEMVKTNYERTLEELKAAAAGDISLGLPEDQKDAWSGDVQFVGPKRKTDNLSWY